MRFLLGRADLLIAQHRPDLAEKELREALAQDPSNGLAHAYLARCLRELKRIDEAAAEAQLAIHLRPDFAYMHYVLGNVRLAQSKVKSAEAAFQEAIRLEPTNPNFLVALGAIRMAEREWESALALADNGLRTNAWHVDCLRLRAAALLALGRKEESEQALRAALARDPQDAHNHTVDGFARLKEGESAKALEAFREALRLDPNDDQARQGMIEALKAEHPLYRPLLRYFIWLASLKRRSLGILFASVMWAGMRLGELTEEHPASFPLRVLSAIPPFLVLFSISAWVVSNALLANNKFGRWILKPNEYSHGRAIAMLVAAAFGIGSLEPAHNKRNAALLGWLIVPVLLTHVTEEGRPRKVMERYTVGVMLAAVGYAMLALTPLRDFGELLWAASFCGCLGSLVVKMQTERRAGVEEIGS